MLNIKKHPMMDYHQEYQLFRSAKACYVMARTSMETAFLLFWVPGLMLMQQALENLLKALLKRNGVRDFAGKKGHDFIMLLEKGRTKIPLFQEFLDKPAFVKLLSELNEGYTAQRYGESPHGIENLEIVMDLFDEMVFLLVNEFVRQWGLTGHNMNMELALPVPFYLREKFERKLKQDFKFLDTSVYEFE